MFGFIKNKKVRAVSKVIALAIPISLIAEPSMAADSSAAGGSGIGGIFENIQNNAIKPAITFIKYMSIAAGVGLSAMGVYDIYKAKTSQGAAGVSMGGAVWKLVIGVGLTSLFFIIQSFQETAGAGKTNLDVGGTLTIG